MSNENEKNDSTVVDTENTKEKATSLKESSASDESSNKKTIYIIEGIIAAAAVVFIIVCLVISGKNKNSDPAVVVSQDAVSNNTTAVTTDLTGATADVEIDNSALYENPPAVPSTSELNAFTEDECAALVEDGSMIKIDGSNGIYVYAPNFSDIDSIKEKVFYTDEEMQDYLYANLLMNFTTELKEERDVCQKYDNVTIDYAGYIDGVQFEGGTAEGQQANLGAGTYIPGFEEGIIGMKVGDTKDVKVTFPENYGATDLAGKDATFKITLQSINGAPAELTDELIAQNFPEVGTVDKYMELATNAILNDKAYDYLIEKYYVSAIDEDAANSYYNSSIEYYDMMSASYYQMSMEDLLAASGGATLDDLKNETMQSCAESALFSTYFMVIGNSLGYEVTEEDITAMRDEYGFTDTQALYDSYGEQTILDYLLTDKVVKHIIELSLSEDTKDEK